MNAKQAVENTIINKRTRQEFFPERQSEVLYFARSQRQGWREVAKQSEDCILRHFPNAEEAQHMVDTDGIKVLFHPAQTTTEPIHEVDLAFAIPVISREAPVLTIQRKCVRRCARGTIHVEEFRMGSRFHALTIHTNRYVALQNHTLRTGIIGSCLELAMEMILSVIDLFSVAREKCHIRL